MTDFYPGVTPQLLIPGDPGELLGLSGGLGRLADAFDAAGRELGGVDPGGWQGDAAESFQQTLGHQPVRYFTAAQSFSTAASAVSQYATTLESCQQVAAQAIASYEEAQTASAGWQQRQTIAQATCTPFTESDPGDAGRAQAQSLLSDARATLDQAAATATSSLASAESEAPQAPGFYNSLLCMVESPLRTHEQYGDPSGGFAFGPATGELTAESVVWSYLRTAEPYVSGVTDGLEKVLVRPDYYRIGTWVRGYSYVNKYGTEVNVGRYWRDAPNKWMPKSSNFSGIAEDSAFVKGAKVAGVAGALFTFGVTAHEEWDADSGDGTAVRATKTLTVASTTTGGALVGAEVGAEWGATAGMIVGGPVGGAVGGVAGAVVGGFVGSKIGHSIGHSIASVF